MGLYTPERRIEVTYQPWAECITEGCGWSMQSSHVARERGKAHVAQTGHEVRFVVERISLWGPKS